MAHFAELKTKPDPTGHTTDTHQVVERVCSCRKRLCSFRHAR